MSKHKGTKVSTLVAPLKYVFITGEGRNQALAGEEPRMQYLASIEVDTDGPIHKDIKAKIYSEWDSYKKTFGVKGLPDKNRNGLPMDGMKPVLIDDPAGTIDPQTEKVQKIPNGKTLITFKTNTHWPDGKPQIVKVFDGTGQNLTNGIQKLAKADAPKMIGEGSTGIIYGTAMGNNTGGAHKVTLYLSGITLNTVEWYEGNDITPEVVEDANAIAMPIDVDDNDTDSDNETMQDTPNI